MMTINLSLCASLLLAGTVLVSTASAQAIDDTPIDPIAVETDPPGGSRQSMAQAISSAR